MVDYCPKCSKHFLTPESLAQHNRNYHQSEYEEDKPREKPREKPPLPKEVKLVPVAEPLERQEGPAALKSRIEITERNAAEKVASLEYYEKMKDTTICEECKRKSLLRGQCMNPDCNFRENRRTCCRG